MFADVERRCVKLYFEVEYVLVVDHADAVSLFPLRVRRQRSREEEEDRENE